MIDIVGKRLVFFLISGVLLLACIVSLAIFGLKPGIDFGGGAITTVHFNQPVDRASLENELQNLGYRARVQPTGEGYYSIRTAALTDAEKNTMQEQLKAKFGELQEVGFDFTDPALAPETRGIAIAAVIASLISILFYIWFAFRKMPNPFRCGLSAVVALSHDVVAVIGLFALFAAMRGWEVDWMFITGVLGIVGYSINNTVVVFDRIRENVKLGVSRDFAVVVNNSVVETMARTFNTTLTTLFAILALMLFVGSSIQNFLVVLMMGLVIGAYDSVCVAPNLLVWWSKRGVA